VRLAVLGDGAGDLSKGRRPGDGDAASALEERIGTPATVVEVSDLVATESAFLGVAIPAGAVSAIRAAAAIEGTSSIWARTHGCDRRDCSTMYSNSL